MPPFFPFYEVFDVRTGVILYTSRLRSRARRFARKDPFFDYNLRGKG